MPEDDCVLLNSSATLKSAFESLCNHGCAPEMLSRLYEQLQASERPPSTLELEQGRPRQLKAMTKHIRTAAEDLRFLLGTHRGKMAAVGNAVPGSDLLTEYGQKLDEWMGLPMMLEGFVENFDSARVRHPRFDSGDCLLATLAAYAKHRTGRAHDREITEIFAAAVRSTDSAADRYSKWKTRHKNLIRMFESQFKTGILPS